MASSMASPWASKESSSSEATSQIYRLVLSKKPSHPLRKKDAVIGPAYDGGYYLIGFKDKTFSPQVFEGIAWGTKTVFDETIKKLKSFRRVVHTLPYQRDIDTAEDLKHLKGKLSSNHP